MVASRTADVQRTKLGTLELVDDNAKEGSPAVFVKLEAAHRLDVAGVKSAGEMHLKAARTGDAAVRLVDEAVACEAAGTLLTTNPPRRKAALHSCGCNQACCTPMGGRGGGAKCSRCAPCWSTAAGSRTC